MKDGEIFFIKVGCLKNKKKKFQITKKFHRFLPNLNEKFYLLIDYMYTGKKIKINKKIIRPCDQGSSARI